MGNVQAFIGHKGGLETWTKKIKSFRTQLGVPKTVWGPLVSAFCFKGSPDIAKCIAATNA